MKIREVQLAKAMWARAEDLVPAVKPGDFNQAMMELGALICTPRSPNCAVCPWEQLCESRALGIQGDPSKDSKKKAPRPIFGAYGLIQGDEGVLLFQRPPSGLLASMWEPLGTPWTDAPLTNAADALRGAARERGGLALDVKRRLGRVVHVFSHRKLTVDVYACTLASAPAEKPPEYYQQWLSASSPHDLALSKLAVKVLDLGKGSPLFGI